MELADLSWGSDLVIQPVLEAGDVLLFTEAALHGTLPWTAAHTRRTAIYRFSPAEVAYGRGYLPSWPEKALEGMTESQRAVMEPPYNVRMSRVVVDDNGDATVPQPREAFKVEFDETVFGRRFY